MHHLLHALVALFAFLLTGSSIGGCATKSAAVGREAADPDAAAEALAARESAHPRASSRAYHHYVLGLLDLHEGRFSSAASRLREAHLYDRESTEILVALAEAQLGLGELESARRSLRRALDGEPDHERALRLMTRLAGASGDLGGAEEVLRGALEASPEGMETRLELARLLIEQGRGEEASRVLFEAPTNGEGWAALAAMLERAGMHQEALAAWKEAGRTDDGPAVHQGVGRACENLGRLDCAIEAYRKALVAGAPESRTQLRLAALFRRAGELEKSRLAEEAAMEAEPEVVSVLVDAALSANARGDVATALSRLDEAEKLDPGDCSASFYRGLVLGERRRWSEAAEAMREVDTEGMYDSDARLHLGSFLSRDGRHEEAIESLESLLGERPGEPRVIAALAEAEARAGHHERAVDRLSRAIESFAGEPLLVEELSLVHARAGEEQEARAVLEEALGSRPDDLGLRYAHGVALERMGRGDEALAEMKKIIEARPDHADALNFIGYHLAEEDLRLEEAERYIRRAYALEPGSGHILDSLGWVLFRRGRVEEAVLKLERAASLLPDHPVVLEHLGEAYAAAGRSGDALRVYGRALELLDSKGDGESERAGPLLEKIEELRAAGHDAS